MPTNGSKVMFSEVSVCPHRSLYDVTSCLAAWPHVPSRGLCCWFYVPSGGLCFEGCLCLGVSVQGVSVWGSLSRGLSRGSSLHGGLGRPPRIRKVGSTTSYWNALLLTRRDRTHSIHINFDFTTGTEKKTTFLHSNMEMLLFNFLLFTI